VMRRFSIRIQILALGMVFVLLLAVSGVLSWNMQNTVARDVHFTFDVIKQNELIAWVREDLEQARADLLRSDAGQEGAFDSLIGNLAEVTRDIAASEGVFNAPESDRARRLDFHERFTAVSADVAALSADLRDIAGTRAERALTRSPEDCLSMQCCTTAPRWDPWAPCAAWPRPPRHARHTRHARCRAGRRRGARP